MKKVIKGKMYNTDTAVLVAEDSFGCYNDLDFWCEELFRKKTGEYFLHGWGGARSAYSMQVAPNTWGGCEKIIPFSDAQAKAWLEAHGVTE